MFQHLLLPLDGTAMAERVIPVARGLVQGSDARITLLHVIERLAPKERHGQAHLQNKDDAAPFDTAYFRMGAVRNLGRLHETAGIGESGAMSGVIRFISDFDVRSRALAIAKDSVDKLAIDVKNGPVMPPDDFFPKSLEPFNSVPLSGVYRSL